ncbi:MAG: hypothetical protein LKK41_03950 [Olsenella sp.]|jgi:ABC-type lipoprotein release transport system permease subunit|nr:hypothetical protein [Olsenella sp.]MCI2156862.1 hypothetical protein [Olsenella sp.]MCI2187503.1 hypothetical protein [Olsenella sp.]
MQIITSAMDMADITVTITVATITSTDITTIAPPVRASQMQSLSLFAHA